MEEATWEPPVNGKVKLKMKRRKSVAGGLQSSATEGKPLSPLTNIFSTGFRPKDKKSTAKRRNPFQCDNNETKRAKIEKLDASNNDLSLFKISRENSFKILDENTVKSGVEISESEGRFETNSLENKTAKSRTENNNENNPATPLRETNMDFSSKGDEIPTDWTLRTKLKFRSDVAFSWCTNLKTAESARGVVDFVRCNTVKNKHDTDKDDTSNEERLKVEFKKSLSSWIHPNLPFIPSFPVSESVMKNNASSICKDEEIRNALMKSWSHSFQSIFTLSKCGFCPYFYFCCQSSTVLFIGSKVLDAQMRAVITPTTKGFREMLQKDGIDFEMPLFDNESSHNTHPNEETEKNCLENDFDSDKENVCKDTANEDFLQSIGLNVKNFSSIKEQKIVDEITRLQSIDRRPKSTIIVKGSNTNALFNFLINSDVMLAQSGPYQGVPPTLLAPVAFEGASLRMLKCVQGPIKFQEKGAMKQVYGLELTGPIMPTQFQGICNLLKARHSRYETTIRSYVPSSALNCLQLCKGCISEEKGNIFSPDFGLDETAFRHITRKPFEGNAFLTGLKFTDGEFEWKTNNA